MVIVDSLELGTITANVPHSMGPLSKLRIHFVRTFHSEKKQYV
jgi:hypothetical protein